MRRWWFILRRTAKRARLRARLSSNVRPHKTMLSSAPRSQNRVLYAFLILAVIAAGLVSRRYSYLLPAQLGKYSGDALWALMVFLIFGFARPKWSIVSTTTAALVTSYAVEFSQLYQAPWLNSIRQTTIGHLVLGSGFHAQDLLAYAVGVVVGSLGEFTTSKPHASS